LQLSHILLVFHSKNNDVSLRLNFTLICGLFVLIAGATEGDSTGSNTSVEADLNADDEIIPSPRHASTTSASAVPQFGSAHWLQDTGGLVLPQNTGDDGVGGSVNVFVVDSKGTSNNGTLQDGGDMKPLMLPIQGDVIQPPAVQADPDLELHAAVAGLKEKASGPVTDDVEPFQAPAAHAAATLTIPGVDQTVSGSAHPLPVVETRLDQPAKPEAAGDDVFPAAEVKGAAPGKAESAAGTGRPAAGAEQPLAGEEKPGDVAEARPVLVLSPSVVVEFVVGWLEAPWLAYLLVVLVATLLSAMMQCDPSLVIVLVLIASAFCFSLFPPDEEDCNDGTPTAKSLQ